MRLLLACLLLTATMPAVGLSSLRGDKTGQSRTDRAGPSRADRKLKADVLRGLQRYSVATYRCARLGQVQAQSLSKRFRANSSVYRRGGHWEAWSARVCGQRRTFLVAMWRSRRGGVDFTIEPQVVPWRG